MTGVHGAVKERISVAMTRGSWSCEEENKWGVNSSPKTNSTPIWSWKFRTPFFSPVFIFHGFTVLSPVKWQFSGCEKTKIPLVQTTDNEISPSHIFDPLYKSHLTCILYKFTHPNVSGTALVITYLNDHPSHRTTNNKGWLNRLQEGRAQLKLDTHNCLDYSIRYPQLPWLFNGMQFRKGWTSSPLISTPYIGPLLFPCQIWSA